MARITHAGSVAFPPHRRLLALRTAAILAKPHLAALGSGVILTKDRKRTAPLANSIGTNLLLILKIVLTRFSSSEAVLDLLPR